MAVNVYPVIQTEDVCNDYEVYVNGKKAKLNTARVSAYPFNRRWPGHQRQIEQTELANFLSLEADEEFDLKIIPKTPSLSVHIRPRSIDAKTTVDANGVIEMHVEKCCQFTVEPYGKSRALHVFVDPISNYNVDKLDKNVLYFGCGEHDVGEIYLQSGQTLYIDEGAVVYATVYGIHVENIKIIGRGILDNSKNKEKILYDINVEGNNSAVNNAKREHAINFVRCKNVEIDGITIRDSLLYNVDSMSCENVRINNIKVIGCWRFNSDGIHFSNCTNCSLTNSFLRTYDDSICIRGFANYEYDRFLKDEREEDLSFICQNIIVKNCVVWNDWGKNMQVGTETYAKEIKDIVFQDCKLIHSSGLALAIWIVDNAKVHDITFENIEVEYDEYMLKCYIQNKDSDIYKDEREVDNSGYLMSCIISKHFEFSLIKTVEELGSINGVKVKDLSLYSIQKPSFVFVGDNPNSLCENVEFENVLWNGEPVSQSLFEKQISKNEYTKNIYLRNKE